LKRHSVFISAPSADARSARELATASLLSAQQIPTCMEFFYSSPQETKKYIEEIIDLCDYYCVILINSYGHRPEDMPVSWTHFEYQVARRRNKPIIAFICNANIANRDPRTSEFIGEIERDGTTPRYWTSDRELGGAIIASVQHLIRQYPAPGWIRTDRYHDDQESLQLFCRRSGDFDFTEFILHPGDIGILLNDGYKWHQRFEAALRKRFGRGDSHGTTFITLDDESDFIPYVSQKSEKDITEQRRDIVLFHEALGRMANETGYKKLRLAKSANINTHCLYMCANYVLVTTYFTSKHRFMQLPLFKYRSGTDIYDDFALDFDLIARPALARLATASLP
jgi:hypothetical protein